MDLKKVVEEKLKGKPRCYGHCSEQAELRLLPEKHMLIGCYSCPTGYVSKIVAYGKEVEADDLKAFVSEATHGIGDVINEDIRVATRYTWDLGIDREPEGVVLREAYWMQSYRRTKSDDPTRQALFLCSKCDSFYHQPATGTDRLCPRCRS
jgi:hypothetical protein